MTFSNEDKKALERVNSVEIPVALFHDAVRALEDLGEDAHVLEHRVPALHALFREKGYSDVRCSQLVKAVEARMEALLRLRSEPEAREWDAPGGGTAEVGHDPYLAAAAKEPLIEHGWNTVAFDRKRFRARMLSLQS